MKISLTYYFILLLSIGFIMSPGVSKAQVAVSAAPVIDSANKDIILPPLDSLFVWAEQYSPTLKGQDALVEKTTEDQKRIKKILLDVVKLGSSIQNGNYGNPTVNQLNTGYSTGASLQFSLYQIFGYKNQVKVYGAERKVAIYKKDELVMDLRKLITILYNNVNGQKNIMRIRSDATYASYSHMKMAEKEFNEGSIAIGELSRVTEIYTKSQVDYEQSLNDLKNFYMELEQIVGRKLS